MKRRRSMNFVLCPTSPKQHHDSKGRDSPYLQLVVLPVHNESCDLLVHEEENCRQESRNDGRRHRPSLEPITKWVNDK